MVEYNDSFSYQFVDPSALSGAERAIFDRTPEILALVGIKASAAPAVQISSTMRVGPDVTEGVWDSQLQSIVIKRTQLGALPTYAGTLLHEAAHASSGASDVTREFESVLTDYLGQTAEGALT
jgi:hypothetical protein